MAIRELRFVGDPVLRTPCEPITEITEGVRSLVQDLLDSVALDGRAGLAANQIGVGLRAFSYNVEGEIGYVLNPVITELDDEYIQDGEEGCLSVPGLWYPTVRAWYAKCKGTDLDGNEVILEGEELMARCIQHEVDHLDGYLYVDRLSKPLRKKALAAISKGLVFPEQ